MCFLWQQKRPCVKRVNGSLKMKQHALSGNTEKSPLRSANLLSLSAHINVVYLHATDCCVQVVLVVYDRLRQSSLPEPLLSLACLQHKFIVPLSDIGRDMLIQHLGLRG